jgi:hypothetical protein
VNYVQHTRTVHEHLSARSDARPHHVSLYWALFFAWNAARFPEALPLDREALMRAAHIGNKDTLTATLRTLSDFGLLAYRPSRSAGASCVVMVGFGGQVPPAVGAPAGPGSPESEATEPARVAPEVREQLPQNWGNLTGEVAPVLGEHSLYAKTGSGVNSVNGAAASSSKKIEVLEGEGLSGAELFDDTAQPNGAGPAQASAPKKKVAPKKMRIKHSEGVEADTIRAAATAPRAAAGRGRTALPELPFSRSPIAQVEIFIAAFQDTDYQLADLRHYHQLVATWRDKKTGLEPTRRDWVATAKRFMLNDAADNRLKLAPAHPAGPDAHDPGAFFARTGFKSKYDT